MKQKIFLLITLTAVLLMVGCNKSSPPTEPPPDEVKKDTVSIAVGDVTHRSISVNVQCTMNNVQWKVSLYRTLNGVDTLVAFFPVTVKDTNIIDDNNGNGLLLDTEYKYYATLTDTAGKLQEKTELITAKTLAPTSHNYTWQEFTIGDANYPSNVLYDVWGTDENNVWAVGGVSINNTFYGVFYWNGSEWIPDSTAGGYAIYGFSNNDIWTVGGGVFHYNGSKWSRVDANDTGQYVVPIDKILHDNIPYTSIWGTSSNNLYLGSGKGKVVHWDGNKATVVDINEGRTIHEMDGYKNDFIVAVGTNFNPPSLTVFYNGLDWNPYPYVNNNYSINSVAVVDYNNIYWAGDGIHLTRKKVFSASFHSGYYIWDIIYNRLTGDLIACGSYDGIYVNNGAEWFNLKGQASTDETTYRGIYSTGDKLFLVGSNNQKAKLIIGRKVQ